MEKTKAFKVVSVSSNTNSFGLRGMVLVAQDGETWQVAANSVNVKAKGDILHVRVVRKALDWASFGFEIPTLCDKAPPNVVKAVWQ